MAKPVTPDASRVAAKWVRRAGSSSQDYTDGAATTSKSQSANARAAKQLWVQQMTATTTHDRWARGLERSGDDGWRAGVREKGAARYGAGVATSEAKFGSRITRILSTIASAEIPPRGLPGSDGNFQRSRIIGQQLNKAKGTFAG
jgi:hypothetical protein